MATGGHTSKTPVFDLVNINKTVIINSEYEVQSSRMAVQDKMVTLKEGDKEQRESAATEECAQTCGCGQCKPQCIQPLATPITYLICISALVLSQSLLVSGYTNSILTTIERQYNLWSSELGLIVSSYDITCMVSVLVVSYLGDRHNRPKWLGRGAIVMCLGAILFTLPYFTGKKYDGGKLYNTTQADINLCNSTQNLENANNECDETRNPNTMALMLFILAQMTLGIGTAPVYTLGPTYLYDNVKTHLYSVYAGVMYSMSALGPAMGFLLGAMFLSIYVEPAQQPAGLTETHTSWVGAWWAGFTICALLAFLVAIPLMMFPKHLLGDSTETKQKQRTPEMMSFGNNIRDFPMQLSRLFRNTPWLFVSLAFVMEQSISTGFVTFIAKYFQLSFDITASRANIITGCVIIPGAFFGIIFGGLLMKKFSLSVPSATKLLLFMNIIPTISVIVLLFLGCQNIDLAGITSDYTGSKTMIMEETISVNYKENLTSPCNAQCACSTQTMYEPVCGKDDKTYYSPCHAGCTHLNVYSTPDGISIRNYSSCACIYEDFVHQVAAAASSGKCDNGCYNLIPFLIILFIIVFVTCCGQNPVLIITLKSVDSGSRSFALGIQNVLCRLLAFIPAPIYFGKIFDSQCLLWAPSCERDGACLEYNIKQLPFVLFGACLALKILTYIFLLVTYFSSRKRTWEKEIEIEEDSLPTGASVIVSTSSSPAHRNPTAFASLSSMFPGDTAALTTLPGNTMAPTPPLSESNQAMAASNVSQCKLSTVSDMYQTYNITYSHEPEPELESYDTPL